MAPAVQTRATLDDLMREEGKAELIGGRIVPSCPRDTSRTGSRASIYPSLLDYAEADATGRGLHRQHRLRGARAPFGPRVVLPRRLLLRRPAAGQPHELHRGRSHPRRRSAQRGRLRPGGRGSPWPPSGPTISPRGPPSSGTSTPWPSSSTSIGPTRPSRMRPTPGARSPRPSPPSPAGGPSVDSFFAIDCQGRLVGRITRRHDPPPPRRHPACASLAGTAQGAGLARALPRPGIRAAGPLGRRPIDPGERGAGPRGGRSDRGLRRGESGTGGRLAGGAGEGRHLARAGELA